MNEFKVLLDAIPDNIILLSPDMKIMWANKAAALKFDRELSQISGEYCYKLCCNLSSVCENYPAIKSFITGKEEVTQVSTSEGRLWDIRAFPITDESGAVKNIIELAKDITCFSRQIFIDRLESEAAFSSIITQNKTMRSIFHYIESIAASRKPILICGETGVGKELIAKAIHDVSGLKGKFVAVNVAGLDDAMFSDTLFGHIKGAFTGADKERKGLIVQASEGTLFLDEIGDLNESSQLKLLRLLEEGMYYRLGSDVPGKSNARIIASTNQDIKKHISQGKFRKDLYFRLNAYCVYVPPLRERFEDVPRLLEHFLNEAAKLLKKEKPAYPPELITLLTNYDFPGNVRELKAMIYDAVARHKRGKLSTEIFKTFIKQKGLFPHSKFLPLHHDTDSAFNISEKLPTIKEAEAYLISEAMKRAKNNQGIAASLLGMNRHALNKRLKKQNKSI